MDLVVDRVSSPSHLKTIWCITHSTDTFPVSLDSCTRDDCSWDGPRRSTGGRPPDGDYTPFVTRVLWAWDGPRRSVGGRSPDGHCTSFVTRVF